MENTQTLKKNTNHFKVTPLVGQTLDYLYDAITTDDLEHSHRQECKIFDNFDKFTNLELESYRVIATKLDEHFKDWKNENNEKPTWEIKNYLL
jgi:hypothetical protein